MFGKRNSQSALAEQIGRELTIAIEEQRSISERTKDILDRQIAALIAREAQLEQEIADRQFELAEIRHVREQLEPPARNIDPAKFARDPLGAPSPLLEAAE